MKLNEGEVLKRHPIWTAYGFTNQARVWSYKSNKFLKVWRDRSYWHRGKLSPGPIYYQLHTEVGRLHLPDYKEGLIICHKDETLPYPYIHWADNLYVGTRKDNYQDCIKKGRWRPRGLSRK